MMISITEIRFSLLQSKVILRNDHINKQRLSRSRIADENLLPLFGHLLDLFERKVQGIHFQTD